MTAKQEQLKRHCYTDTDQAYLKVLIMRLSINPYSNQSETSAVNWKNLSLTLKEVPLVEIKEAFWWEWRD